MKNWQIALASTALTLAIGGTYLLIVWHHRRQPAVTEQTDDRSRIERLDDAAIVRTIYPTSFDDLKPLEGKPVWMKNGYTMSYYPYADGRVDFAKRAGVIPSAARLDVKKIVKVSAPANAHDGIEPAGPQAFAVFSLAGGNELYSTPVGTMAHGAEAYYSDILFYYDDPHKIYDHWPKDVWAAVDAHQAKTGMTELETQMAIGRKMRSDSQDVGDRTVSYDQNGKHWTVTFVKDQATAVKSE
ncbi:MAG: hypothetical protein WCE75_10915 [Terracidiphilus sp.]